MKDKELKGIINIMEEYINKEIVINKHDWGRLKEIIRLKYGGKK